MAVTRLNIDGWLNYIDVIQNIRNNHVNAQRKFLERLGFRYLNRIQANMSAQNIDASRTYRNSLRLDKRQLGNKFPRLSLIIQPTGPERDRIGIYWKTLEFGSSPNPNVPNRKLIQWAGYKGVNPAFGVLAAEHIRAFGTRPHPVLSDIFIIAPNSGEIIDVTSLAKSIAEEEGRLFLRELESIFEEKINRRGKTISIFRGPGGRFTSGR